MWESLEERELGAVGKLRLATSDQTMRATSSRMRATVSFASSIPTISLPQLLAQGNKVFVGNRLDYDPGELVPEAVRGKQFGYITFRRPHGAEQVKGVGCRKGDVSDDYGQTHGRPSTMNECHEGI